MYLIQCILFVYRKDLALQLKYRQVYRVNSAGGSLVIMEVLLATVERIVVDHPLMKILDI